MSAYRGDIGFIGAGTVGTTLALALAARGPRVVAVASRSPRSAEALASRLANCAAVSPDAVAEAADLVFITTPDDAIAGVAAGTAWRAGQIVAHCSGVYSLEPLAPAARRGAHPGSFHPLQTFAEPEAAVSLLAGSTVAIEGDPEALAALEDLARRLGTRSLRLGPGDKALYHTAAVMTSNYTVALVAEAAALWAALGVSRQEAVAALLPLLRGTMANLEHAGLPGALTGPIPRGDATTVARHLEALRERAPGTVDLYLRLGLAALRLAGETGRLTPSQVRELARVLEAEPVTNSL